MIRSDKQTGLLPEEEQCPGCLQLYAFELEYRCRDCDHPVCPVCVVRIESAWLCPGCLESE